MFNYILSPDLGFHTRRIGSAPALNLCTDDSLGKTQERLMHDTCIVNDILRALSFTGDFTKQKLGNMYYPLIVAIRVHAYESAGFLYNRTAMIMHIGWHYYGRKTDKSFISFTWFAYLIIKEFYDDFNITLYSNVFYPLLPNNRGLHTNNHMTPKYWGKTITEENELSFLGQKYYERSDDGVSKGELAAMDYLKRNHIEYVHDEPVDYECKYCKRHRLRPDFYLPEYNIIIEIHGPQHLDYSKGFHLSYDDFIDQQLRDIDMRNYCHINGITLIEIPYNDQTEIPHIIARSMRTATNKDRRLDGRKYTTN